MITKNGYKFIGAFLSNNDTLTNCQVSLTTTANGSANFKVIWSGDPIIGWALGAANNANNAGYQGSLYYLSDGYTAYYGAGQTESNAIGGVWIGDGDTAPTVDDYKLAGNQITTFTANTSISVSITDKILITATYNITNTSGSPIIIKEYGIFIRNGGTGKAMLARDVLATPITIAGNGTGTMVINYTIS